MWVCRVEGGGCGCVGGVESSECVGLREEDGRVCRWREGDGECVGLREGDGECVGLREGNGRVCRVEGGG